MEGCVSSVLKCFDQVLMFAEHQVSAQLGEGLEHIPSLSLPWFFPRY